MSKLIIKWEVSHLNLVKMYKPNLIKKLQLKNKIILNFIKIDKIVSDGNDIYPVQIGMKLVDEKEKEVGRPQTITSFYNHPAYFEVPSTGLVSDVSDLKVHLSFEERN